MSAAEKRRMSVAEYFAFEASAEEKHEFADGEMWPLHDAKAMAGARVTHVVLTRNATVLTTNALRGRPCQAYGSDLRIGAIGAGKYGYPDLSIVCGPIRFDPADPARMTATNPRVLFEVLSPDTELHDRSGKFARYQAIETFTDYVLVATREIRVEHFARQPDGAWLLRHYVASDSLPLLTIDIALPIDDLYLGYQDARAQDDGA